MLQDICLPLPVMDLSLAREEVVQVRLKDRTSISDKRSIWPTSWTNIDSKLPSSERLVWAASCYLMLAVLEVLHCDTRTESSSSYAKAGYWPTKGAP